MRKRVRLLVAGLFCFFLTLTLLFQRQTYSNKPCFYSVNGLEPGLSVETAIKANGRPDFEVPNLMSWTRKGITVIYNESDQIVAVSGKRVEFGNAFFYRGDFFFQARMKAEFAKNLTVDSDYYDSKCQDPHGNLIRLKLEESDLLGLLKVRSVAVVSSRIQPDKRSTREQAMSWRTKTWRTWKTVNEKKAEDLTLR